MSSRRESFLALLWPLAVITAAIPVRAFNSEGQTAIVWQNDVRKEAAVWFMDRTRFLSAAWLSTNTGQDWRIAGLADFNRDGQPDLLWRSPSTGRNELELLNDLSLPVRQPIPSSLSGFEIAGTGDFDGDGYPDIVWRNPAWNQTAVWFMEGTNWAGRASMITPDPEFRLDLVATGDFNHDGFTDLVWRDRYGGANFVWLMRGAEMMSSVEIKAQPDMGFRLAGTGVFNLLGRTDLVWRHANGHNEVWLMNGTEYLSSVPLPTEFNASWRIAGTGGYTNRMLLSAAAQEDSQSLTLAWRHGSGQPPDIERRVVGQSTWDRLATNHVPFRFTDSDITPGQRYEYRVGGEYLLGGIAAAPIEDRGRIIVIVEKALSSQIAVDLELLKTDLVGDGWSVIWTNAPRHDDETWSRNNAAIASIKSFITNAYYQDPARTKAVFLIGHVPIPYSGFQNPDGHGGRALPADLYYGDVDGIYTDSTANYSSYLEGPHYARHDNVIGDGKFDQIRIPENAQGVAVLEMAVGRADFSDLPSFGASSEAELTGRYLQKAHRYRHKQYVLPDRIMVSAQFSTGPNREAYAQALRIGSRWFGLEPGKVVEGDPFDPSHSALWGILGGSGLPFGLIGGEGYYRQSANMPYLAQEPRIAFANVFASFLHDFHYTDNFMRAFLATPSYGLAIMWFRPLSVDRIPLAFENLGLGETLGSGFVRSISESQQEFSANTYVALMGDPSLRLQVLAPPRALPKTPAPDAPLEWAPPVESRSHFFVYRSTHGLDGPWLRITPRPIAETYFIDPSAPPGPKMYQVRSVQLVTTGSGSYTNLSQGIFIDAP